MADTLTNMASNSASANEIHQLLQLQRQGILSTADFVRMASEISKTHAQRLSEAIEKDSSNEGNGEVLVDEDGMLFEDAGGTGLDALSGASHNGSFDDDKSSDSEELLVNEDGDAELFVNEDDEEEASPASPASPAPVQMPSGPVSCPPNTKVESVDHGEVTFLRMGNTADFINAGRARIQYQKLKRGAKYKMETHFGWVKAETLTLPATDAAGADEGGSPARKSPRLEVRAAARRETTVDGLPELATHERARKLSKKPEAPVRGHNKSTRQTAESKVSIDDRIEEFPDNSLAKVLGKLKCQACNFHPANKWSSIKLHCGLVNGRGNPTAHAIQLAAWRARTDDDGHLKQILVDYFESHPDEVIGTTDQDLLLYRYRVAQSFTKSPPFSAVDNHKHLLERAGFTVPTSRNLKRFIPQIEDAEDKQINEELVGQYVGIGFDGTTRLGEAINTTGRWCTKDFKIVQRLLDFTTTEKHVDNVQLAALITNVIMHHRQIPLDHLVNIARDSVSVNGAACRRLKTTFTSAADSLCICHTLCHVGEHFELPTLKEFKTPWLELVGGRDPHRGAQALWKETVAPASVPGYSKVRWYSWAEILFVIAEAGIIQLGSFITKCEERDFGDATTKSLRHIYDTKSTALCLELASMLDMRTLVAQTYALEGDRLEVLLVYERIEALRALGRSISAKEDGILPNVDAVLRGKMVLKKGVKMEKHYDGHGKAVGTLDKKEKVGSTLYPGQEREAWLVRFADGTVEHFEDEELRSGKDGPVPNGQDGKPVLIVRDLAERKSICDALKPGFDYLEARLTGPPACNQQYSLVEMYELCRVARAFDPAFASANVDAAFVDSMSAITPLRSLGMLDDLKQQLPQYLAAAAHAPAVDKSSVADYTEAILTWWRDNSAAFPAWALAARIVFAISPNSASCERVFALLKRLFGDQQMNALADYVSASLKLNANDRIVG